MNFNNINTNEVCLKIKGLLPTIPESSSSSLSHVHLGRRAEEPWPRAWALSQWLWMGTPVSVRKRGVSHLIPEFNKTFACADWLNVRFKKNITFYRYVYEFVGWNSNNYILLQLLTSGVLKSWKRCKVEIINYLFVIIIIADYILRVFSLQSNSTTIFLLFEIYAKTSNIGYESVRF